MKLAPRLAAAALVALPGALTVYLAFNAGGYFAFAPAVVAAVLAVVLVLRVLLAERPFAGLSPAILVVLGAMTLLTVWTLASSAWSHAPGRALIEFDYALVYLLALAVCASVEWTVTRIQWVVRSLAAASLVVSVIALITRVLPRVWPVKPTLHPERLSYPLTYWNSLGLLAILGFLLCVYMTTSEREPKPVRIASAAAVPLLASTALFTYSRGALTAAIVALIAYVVLARPRGFVAGFVAAAPPTAIALLVTYRADKLSSQQPTNAAAVSQGHKVALALLLSAIAAAVLRSLVLGVDGALARRAPRHLSTRSWLLAGGAALAVIVAVSLSLDVPNSIGHEYKRFVRGGEQLNNFAHVQSRLTDPGNNDRLKLWHVSLIGYHASAFHGSGAGTFENLWNQHRTVADNVTEAHGTYAETLGELGIVGLALLLVVVVGTLIGLAIRIRGPNRALYAALFAVALAWALRATVDWDWETPAVALTFFVVAGMGLARLPDAQPARRLTSTPLRLAIAVGILVVAITPVRVAVSQAKLETSIADFKAGACPAAIDAALGSNSAIGSRAEPFEILGFCDVRLGRNDLALTAMHNAVQRDPSNWEMHYGLALAQAVAGQDPRPQADLARRLNPLNELASSAAHRFRADRPSRWRRDALASELPVS